MATIKEYTAQEIKDRFNADYVKKNSDGSYTWYQRNPYSSGPNTGTVPGTNRTFITAPTGGPLSKIQDNLNAGVGTAQGALNAANNAANFIKNGLAPGGVFSSNYNKINQFADDAYNSAMEMNPNIGHVEYSAFDLYNSSDDLMSSAKELYSMNAADQNSLIGQYINSVKQIDPNRYVAMAASDTQSSFDNARGQLERGMGRLGMGASGQAATLQKNWGVALASAMAGAKTKARQQGITERLNALKDSVGLANTMQGQAQGQKESAGKMQATAAQLRAEQANQLTNAGRLTQAAADGLLSSMSAYNDATGRQINAAQLMIGAQTALAEFYSSYVNSMAQYMGKNALIY